jgi:hypothetical protein
MYHLAGRLSIPFSWFSPDICPTFGGIAFGNRELSALRTTEGPSAGEKTN